MPVITGEQVQRRNILYSSHEFPSYESAEVSSTIQDDERTLSINKAELIEVNADVGLVFNETSYFVNNINKINTSNMNKETEESTVKGEPNLDLDDASSSSSDEKSDRVGKHGKQDPKICGVCGDKALGNNFNAITCESCKAFFRRNALRPKEFLCPFNNACKVDPVTRRFCQKCRLKKCFDIGMKKEWIMTDEEKKIKKQKIEQNRLKRTSSDNKFQHSYDREEATAPKIPAVDEQLSNKITNVSQQQFSVTQSPSTIHSPTGLPTKQPMMPHNNNTLHPPLLTAINLEMSNSESGHIHLTHEQHSELELSRTQVMHSPKPQPHSGIAHLYNYNNNNPPTTINWGENTENANSFSHVPHFLQEEETTRMPLLSSLVRPGVAESPPETFDECGNSNSDGSLPPPRSPQEHLKQTVPHPLNVPLLNTNNRSILNYNNASPTDIDMEPTPSLILPHSPYGDEGSSSPPLDEKELPPLPLNTMDSILSVAISAEFNAFESLRSVGGDSSRPFPRDSKELNKAEKAKLNELFFASQALNAPVDADGPIKIETCDPSLINVINLTDVAIRRLIKMSKKIGVFKSMCQEDQIALLKGGCTEMMILRSVVSYDPERDSWNIPHSNGYNIKLGVLKEARGNLYEEHQHFVRSFKAEWRSDDNIMIILCAITLFTPERPNVIHKDVVKLEQDSYYYLLKRYLESTRNGCEARSTYLQLIKKIAELHVLNSNHLRAFLDVNPREVEPLLIEIFDLKQ